jgi:4-hydroxyphenylpyruvate dioxygenase-like putative hemolysin
VTANQASALAQRFNLGPMDQVAFLVRNMDQALPAYEALFGPFNVMAVGPVEVKYRGKTIFPKLKLALGKSGPMEIELCEAVGGGPPHGEHLERHGEGLYHVRFKVQRLHETLQAMETAGFVNVYSGESETVRFAYVEAPATLGHTLLELVERLPSAS